MGTEISWFICSNVEEDYRSASRIFWHGLQWKWGAAALNLGVIGQWKKDFECPADTPSILEAEAQE